MLGPLPATIRWSLGVLLVAGSAGCALDVAGLGDSIDLGDDAGADVTVVERDVALDDTATDDVSIDDTSVVLDTAVEDTTVTPDAADAKDTAVALDTLDAADTADTAEALIPCAEPGGVRSGGHCYFPLATAAAFAVQRDACTAKGAHLAAITSGGEQGVVAGRGTGDRWIGLIKDTSAPSAKASFRWITSESSLVYDNWAVGDPNGGHDCARMKADGMWADQACTNAYPAVCERE